MAGRNPAAEVSFEKGREMNFAFNRRPAPERHPDDWVSRVFARFMAKADHAHVQRSEEAMAALRTILAEAVAKRGLRTAARDLGLPLGVVRAALDDRDVRVSSASAIAAALGYTLKIERAGRAAAMEATGANSDAPITPQPEWPADKEARRQAFNAHLREVIDAALIASGKSARAVSMEIVGHDGLIRDIRRGNVPTADKLAALAMALDLDFHFGPAPHRGGGVK